MTSFERTPIQPAGVWTPDKYPYSHAVSVKAQKMLFISGQVALDENANFVGVGDMAAQTRQVYANLGAVLASVGADFSHVIELTTFIVGRETLPAHLATLEDLYKDLYPHGAYPCDNVILVAGLYREEFLLEVKALAASP